MPDNAGENRTRRTTRTPTHVAYTSHARALLSSSLLYYILSRIRRAENPLVYLPARIVVPSSGCYCCASGTAIVPRANVCACVCVCACVWVCTIYGKTRAKKKALCAFFRERTLGSGTLSAVPSQNPQDFPGVSGSSGRRASCPISIPSHAHTHARASIYFCTRYIRTFFRPLPVDGVSAAVTFPPRSKRSTASLRRDVVVGDTPSVPHCYDN